MYADHVGTMTQKDAELVKLNYCMSEEFKNKVIKELKIKSDHQQEKLNHNSTIQDFPTKIQLQWIKQNLSLQISEHTMKNNQVTYKSLNLEIQDFKQNNQIKFDLLDFQNKNKHTNFKKLIH